MEAVDRSSASRGEGRVLLDAVCMKAINPEDGVIDSVSNCIGAIARRKQRDPPQAQCAQDGVVELGGPSDVRNTDARVVDHLHLPGPVSLIGSYGPSYAADPGAR